MNSLTSLRNRNVNGSNSQSIDFSMDFKLGSKLKLSQNQDYFNQIPKDSTRKFENSLENNLRSYGERTNGLRGSSSGRNLLMH